jgi:uncharacterized membrane protein
MPEEGTISRPKGDKHPIFNASLSAVLIIILLALVSAAIYVIPAALHSDPFTEFYLLGPNGKADNYPREFNISEPQPVIIGVVNHEHKDMDYDLVVMLENGTQKHKLYEDRISLADDAAWLKQVSINPPVNGTNMKLDFRLFENGNMTVPYRDCFLYINVTTPWVPQAMKARQAG